MIFIIAFFSAIALCDPSPVLASPVLKAELSFNEKDSLRYHLENLYNEVSLLIRNQKVNEQDLKRQENEIELWQLYQRIPFERNLPDIEKSVKDSLAHTPFELESFQITGFSPSGAPLPQMLRTSQRQYEISEDQLVEKIFFVVRIQARAGKDVEQRVKNWVKGWSQNVFRLIELDGPPMAAKSASKSISQSGSIQKLKGHQKNHHSIQEIETWRIKAHAFRFRQIQYPEIRPENPIKMLPNWAQADPKRFQSAEPLLWSFVTRTEELIPKTPQLYQLKRQFLLNDARTHFFLSKLGHS